MKQKVLDPAYKPVDDKIREALKAAVYAKSLFENPYAFADKQWRADRAETFDAVIAGLVALQMLGEKLFEHKEF